MPRSSASFSTRLAMMIALAAAAKTVPVPFSVPSHADHLGGEKADAADSRSAPVAGRKFVLALFEIERCVLEEQNPLSAATGSEEGFRCPISKHV